MSVAVQLGLDRGIDSELLIEAEECWRSWVAELPVLAPVGELAVLPGWLRTAEPAAADEVLLALVQLGSPAGSDLVVASAVVAWALLPGACTLARRLRPVSAQVDVLVAAQLWVEVRSFDWWRRRKVAANVLARTRCQVLAECGVSSQVRRLDPMRAATTLHDPLSAAWVERLDAASSSGPNGSGIDVRELLAEAASCGLLSRLDGLVLERLLVHADRLAGARAGRGQGGLLAGSLVAVVAAEVGLSPASVRRRTRRVVQRLAEAHRTGLVAA